MMVAQLLTSITLATVHRDWAVVTGASSGIGAEISRLAADRGYNLILAARRRDRLEKLAAEIGDSSGALVECVACDLSSTEGVASLCEVSNRHPISLAVLNAGVCESGGLCELSDAQVAKVLDLNVRTTTTLLRHFGGMMPGAKGDGSMGRILLIASSAAAAPGIPGVATYAASKAYLRSLAHGARAELKSGGLSITCAMPSAVDGTEFSANSGLERSAIFSLPGGVRRLGGTVMSADAVAKCALDAALRGRAEVVPGLFPRVFVGMTDRRLLPGRWARGIAAFCFADAPFGRGETR